MIQVSDLSLTIQGAPILHEVTLNIQQSKVTAIIGPNGAGKSSLLKTMAGQHLNYRGEVQINGKNLKKWDAKRLASTRAILSQQTFLSFNLSVWEVVKLGRFPYAKIESRTCSDDITHKSLKLVGLDHFASRDMFSLSGGEQQRVHFARVLAQLYEPMPHKAKYLLLDEPSSSLDIAQKHHLLKLITRIAKQQGYGILMVIHDINLAAQYADELILLKQGRVKAHGATEEVLTPENIQQTFEVEALVQLHPIENCPQVCIIQNQRVL